jgi:hypothetical protein
MSPYRRIGKCIYRSDTGAKVGCSKSVPMAKKYLAVLNMREHGVKPKPEEKKESK